MKLKLFVPILTLILIMSVAGTVLAYSDINSYNASASKADSVISAQPVTPSAEKVISLPNFTAADDDSEKNVAMKSVRLTYSEKMQKFSVGDCVVYTDSDANLYHYEPTGELYGFFVNSADAANIKSTLSEKELKNFALKYVTALYGDSFDGFKFTKALFKDDVDVYTFTFSKMIGDFKTSDKICIDLLLDGTVVSVSHKSAADYSSLNASRLDSYNEAELEEYALNEVETVYGDKLLSAEVKSVEITSNYGKMFFKIIVYVTYDPSDEGIADASLSSSESVYYEID